MNPTELKQYMKGQDIVAGKEHPILKGSISTYKGKEQVGLWCTPEFKTMIKTLVKEAIKEM